MKPSSLLEEGANPSEAYVITAPPSNAARSELLRIINPRRGVSQSVPGLDITTGAQMGDTIFEEFGLDQYVGCVTAEMPSRPVPHAFRLSKLAQLQQLFSKWAPLIYSKLIPQIEPPTQTFNKTSRLGWPYFTSAERKADVVLDSWDRLKREGSAYYKRAFVIMNVRLQPEPREKERDFMFIDDQGVVYAKKIGERERSVQVGKETRVGSRTRLVFNHGVYNLVKQVLDTAIHNVFMKYPAFHHDMFGGKVLPVRGKHLCLDVKHMERFTVAAISVRNEIIGGLYGELGKLSLSLPYACPSDTRKEVFFLRPNREQGWIEQYSSGDSAVAPAQKELFLALLAEFMETHLGVMREEAIGVVMQGGTDKLTIRNYGDDNSYSGDEAILDDLYAFLASYLTVEVETPPKFLGFQWWDELGWRLGLDSYLTKTYLNERRPFSHFRRYPYLGWVEKRKVYRTLGLPIIPEKVYPFEDHLLQDVGMPWFDIEHQGLIERRNSLTQHQLLTSDYFLGREYALTAEQKLQTGEYDGLPPSLTAGMVAGLLSAEWRKKLTWQRK